MASDASKSRKDRIDNSFKMVVSPSNDLPPEVVLAASRSNRVVGFSDTGGNEGLSRVSEAARAVSQRQESKRSRVFRELHQQRAEQSHFITFRLMNNGALRQVLEHMFRIACSHGSDLEDGRMSRRNFRIFLEEMSVTTFSPYDRFEPRSVIVIRDKNAAGMETADEVQLLRFGYENVDTLFDYGLDRIGRVVVTAMGASPDFDETQRRGVSPGGSPVLGNSQMFPQRQENDTDDRLTFHEFLIANIECVHRMIPPDYYPPLTTKPEVHNIILETFFFHMFGKPYIANQIPTSFDDLNMVETMAEVIGNSYDLLADVFLYCVAPTKYEEWTEQERLDRYVKIACGDACIEFEALMDAVKKFRMPLNLLAAEPTYELFCRYDAGIKKERAVIDFQGFTLVCAHMAFTLFLTNAAYPTPQSKFQRLVEQYISPQFERRQTIPPPQSASKMVTLEAIKPERATVGTELWVFGTEFPIRATQNGHRCPLYVRFNDTIAKGACMSTTVGNVIVPRLPTTPDTITQVSLADGEEPGTFVVRLEAKTIALVYISNDRLRWTQSQTVRLSFEDVLATYVIPNDIVQTLRSLFSAFGEKGPDYELNGDVLQGPTYLSIPYYSKMCQQLPLCVFDDGDTSQYPTRHTKFFESAKPRSDALDITVPVLTFPELVNTIFKQFISQHGPDERLIETLALALSGAQAVIDKQLLEKRPRRSNTAMGAARLAEYQKILSQVHAQTVREGNCVNCGQDPVVRAGENPFIDLEMIKRPALKKREDTAPDMVFSRAIAVFSDSLPRDAVSEEITESQFTKMTVEQADLLSDRGKLYFLNNLVQRLLDTHEEDFQALEMRFAKSVEKSRTHGRYVTMQCLMLQQTLETISDGLSRIGAIVVEHENLVLQDRKARLNGFVAQSDTAYAMLTQLYQGMKATINTVRDMTRLYVTDDEQDVYDVKYMFSEAFTYKQHLMQQTLQLESAIKLRLDEIRCGPDISAEGLVPKKYLSDDGDEDPEQAALRRQMSQAGADLLRRQSSLSRRGEGVSDEEVQHRLQAQQEMLEVAFEQKLKESEKKKDQIIREATLLMEGLVAHTQDYIEIPSSLGNPCFKFLHDRGSTLKRTLREFGGAASSINLGGGGGGGGGGGSRRPFVLTEDVGLQSDEDQFPSMLAMQKDLLARGLTNGAKLGGPAVLLRKALTYAKEVLGKYSSNATIFSELSKIIKLELQNVMNPRTRDLVTVPQSESEMYSRDSVVNTELTFSDFAYVSSYVKHQVHLEDLVNLVNVAKEEAAAAAAKAARRGANGRRSDVKVKPSLDVPISPNTAALAARPDEMMGVISLESILPLETRVERLLLQRNAKLLHALHATQEDRCKETATDPLPTKCNVQCEANIITEGSPRRGEDGDDDDGEGKKKKGKKAKKEPDSPSVSRGKGGVETPPRAAAKPPTGTPSKKALAPKTKLKLENNSHQDEDGNGGASVVDEDAMVDAMDNAEAYSLAPSVAQKLQGSDDKTKKKSNTTAGTGKNAMDIPGPSLVRAEDKTIPQSLLNTGQTTEGLMQEKWDEVRSSQQQQQSRANALFLATTADVNISSRQRDVDDEDDEGLDEELHGEDESQNDDEETEDEETDDDDDDTNIDKPFKAVYVEEDVIPEIELISREVRASREAQTREIEASTAKLTAAIEEAMKKAPEAAALHIELQGMVGLVHQLRAKVGTLEEELDRRQDQNKSLRENLNDQKRQAMQNLDGKSVVVREIKGTKAVSIDQQQLDAARQILSDKAMVRSRVAKIIRKYGLSVSPYIQQKFDESVGSGASSGLLELEELMEEVLAHSKSLAMRPHPSAFAVDAPATSVETAASIVSPTNGGGRYKSNFFQALSDDCLKMLRVHFSDDPMQLHGLTPSAQTLIDSDPLSAMPVLARALLHGWDASSVDQMVEATTNDPDAATKKRKKLRVDGDQLGDVPGMLTRKPSHAAAASFFKTLMHNDAQDMISDAEIQTASEAVRQMRVSTPTSKERVMFMIAQHEAAQHETGSGHAMSETSRLSSPAAAGTPFPSIGKLGLHGTNGMMSAVTAVPPLRVPPSLARLGVVSPVSESGEGPFPRSSSSVRMSPQGLGVPRLSLLFPNHHQAHRQQQGASATDFGTRSMNNSPAYVSESPTTCSISTQTKVHTSTIEVQTDDKIQSPASHSHSSDDSMYHIGGAGDDRKPNSDSDDDEFDYAAYYPTAVPNSNRSGEGALDSAAPVAVLSQNGGGAVSRMLLADVTTSSTQTDIHGDVVALSKQRQRLQRAINTRDAATQGDESGRHVFIASLPWHAQASQLLSAVCATTDVPRTHEQPLHQWLIAVLHCLRSNMAPNLEFLAEQLVSLRHASEKARDNIADLSYALLSSAIHAVQVLDESCGGPLQKFLQQYGDVDILRGPRRHLSNNNSETFEEVNALISNLMQHIDHRVSGPRATHVANSQRSLNRWRTHIVLTLLDAMEPELQPCFPQHQRDLMSKLVEYEELSLVQQRQLFFLQTTALSLIIFSHCSRKSFVPLAHAAKVDNTPLPLSLQASSSSYLRMVRDCLLNKILPNTFNDIGLKSTADLSWMTKHFVSRILSFSTEEFSWLHQLSKEQRNESEQQRYDDMLDVVEKSKKWNPSKHDISSLDWLNIVRSAVVIILGPGGRVVPASMHELGPRPEKSAKALPPPSPVISSQQHTVVVDEPQAKQPSSLHEPPSFLRDVSWAKPALHRPNSFSKPINGSAVERQHASTPAKCDTPPPVSTWKAKSGGQPDSSAVRPNRASSLTPTAMMGASAGNTAIGPFGANASSGQQQAFSASSNPSVVSTILHGMVNTVRPLTLGEQRELRDLRELCAGKLTTTNVPPPRSYRAWLDLEARQRVAELRATDLDATPSPVQLQDSVSRALQTVGLNSTPTPANIGSTLSQLSAAQTKIFVQVLRGEELRGSRLPAIE